MKSVPFTIEIPKTMGCIATRCKVSEAYDPEECIGQPHPKFESFDAIWDTGAMRTTISTRVAEKLGLVPYRQAKVFHADGASLRNVYFINLLLPNKIEIKNLIAVDGNLEDVDVLIGMDIISMCDFALTGKSDNIKFSFQIPGQLDIDFTKLK